MLSPGSIKKPQPIAELSNAEFLVGARAVLRTTYASLGMHALLNDTVDQLGPTYLRDAIGADSAEPLGFGESQRPHEPHEELEALVNVFLASAAVYDRRDPRMRLHTAGNVGSVAWQSYERAMALEGDDLTGFHSRMVSKLGALSTEERNDKDNGSSGRSRHLRTAIARIGRFRRSSQRHRASKGGGSYELPLSGLRLPLEFDGPAHKASAA